MPAADSNKTALITGASSGIGRALTLEFAAAGYDLFLVARDQAALGDIAGECEKLHHVKAEIYSADLSAIESIDTLAAAISQRQFDVLVNNAGFGIHGPFTETPVEKELQMLDLQLAAMMKLTKAVLPRMIAQKSGRMLNVASVYSFAPVPEQAVYSACKSFIFSFSSALRAELKNSGVSISVLCPGITQTEFRTRAGITGKKNSGMTAAAVAKIAFTKMISGTHLIVPGFTNKVFVFLSRHLPFSLQTALINFINAKRGVNKT